MKRPLSFYRQRCCICGKPRSPQCKPTLARCEDHKDLVVTRTPKVYKRNEEGLIVRSGVYSQE